MSYPPRLSRLLESFRRLPGVGPKSAQRIAFHLLDRDRATAAQLAAALTAALEGVVHCSRCRMYCEDDRCPYCSDARRAQGSLCVVETPADLIAVEQGAGYRGRYFVLMGRLSPLDGIGPQELGLDLLQQQLRSGDCSELIIATGSTVEGEATAYYLGEMARAAGVAVTRIAHGVPLGGELEYVDGGTLARAFDGRRPLA